MSEINNASGSKKQNADKSNKATDEIQVVEKTDKNQKKSDYSNKRVTGSTSTYKPVKAVPAEDQTPAKDVQVTNNTDYQLILNADGSDNNNTTYILGPKSRVKLRLTDSQVETLKDAYSNQLSFYVIN